MWVKYSFLPSVYQVLSHSSWESISWLWLMWIWCSSVYWFFPQLLCIFFWVIRENLKELQTNLRIMIMFGWYWSMTNLSLTAFMQHLTCLLFPPFLSLVASPRYYSPLLSWNKKLYKERSILSLDISFSFHKNLLWRNKTGDRMYFCSRKFL